MTRPLGKFEVYQRTRDGMFNATSLLAQWNKAKNSNKRIQDFFENQNTKDFIEALMEEENLKVPNLAYLKTRGKYNGGTWMHPYLFVKFAMWLNPRFEVKVVKFLYDQLDVDYSQVARGLNWIVFNKHERDIRNTASPNQLRALDDLQRKLAFSVDMGYIRTFPDLMNSMRRIYNRQHAKF